jgi:hypothetical protein
MFWIFLGSLKRESSSPRPNTPDWRRLQLQQLKR